MVIAELLRMVLPITLGNFQLLRRHVNADDAAAGTHQLGENVHVAARATAKVEHVHPSSAGGMGLPHP